MKIIGIKNELPLINTFSPTNLAFVNPNWVSDQIHGMNEAQHDDLKHN